MTTRACPKCSEELPIDRFQRFNGRPSGWCRSCRTKKERERRLAKGVEPKNFSRIEGDQKLCMGCKVMKPFEDFSPAPRGLGGLCAYCKPCHADRYRNAAKARVATGSYRERNRARYLANHRLAQFKRRATKEVTSDGTVTDEFLESIYATPECAYCEKEIVVEQRTADHVIPLARNGAHSASNIVMACNPCNSSKGGRTDMEFIGRRVL